MGKSIIQREKGAQRRLQMKIEKQKKKNKTTTTTQQ